jgi:hypothetical protein
MSLGTFIGGIYDEEYCYEHSQTLNPDCFLLVTLKMLLSRLSSIICQRIGYSDMLEML